MESQKLKYDHMGIPTMVKKEGMIHASDPFNVWFTPYEKSPFRIEWVYFEERSHFHPLIKTMPHVAFIVEDLKKALEGKKILFQPERWENIIFAFIEDDGIPIEFIQYA